MGDDFVFQNKQGHPIHRETINQSVINPTLKKLGISSPISIKDTRASYITNSLDNNERMSFIQKQVGHTTPRMIVDHYYRYVSAPDDGAKLEMGSGGGCSNPPLRACLCQSCCIDQHAARRPSIQLLLFADCPTVCTCLKSDLHSHDALLPVPIKHGTVNTTFCCLGFLLWLPTRYWL